MNAREAHVLKACLSAPRHHWEGLLATMTGTQASAVMNPVTVILKPYDHVSMDHISPNYQPRQTFLSSNVITSGILLQERKDG